MFRIVKAFGKLIYIIAIIIIDNIIPKKYIILGSNNGECITGNSAAFYEYLTVNKKNVYYYLKQRGKERNNKNNNIIYWKEKRTWKILLRSSIIILSHGFGDLKPYINYLKYCKKRIIIQLWHGDLVKNIGELDHKLNKKEKLKLFRETKYYNLMISGSETSSIFISKCFNINKENVAVTGLPRYDWVIKSKEIGNQALHKYYKDIPVYNKAVLYAPTFREYNKEIRYFPFDEKHKELLEFLEKEKIVIFIRNHINTEKMSNAIKSNRIVSFSFEMEPDISKILGAFDYLITDYSSIFIDYLLLDRPIAFIPYDLEEYLDDRGLLYEYESITPGKYIYSYNDLITFISAKDVLREKRKYVMKLMFRYKDNRNCERLFNLLLKKKYI